MAIAHGFIVRVMKEVDVADTKKQIQKALLEGVAEGLKGEALFQFAKRATKAKDKKIVYGAFFALSDPDLKDRAALDTLFELGLSHRLRDDDGDQPEADAPSSKAASLPLPETAKKKKSEKSKKD